jgi:cob(I)alamin adenosyltransferase
MKVYTKTGDTGTTALIGGTRVPKDHIRIEAYGSVDELNAHLGLLRDITPELNISSELISIQETLFVIGSHLANDLEKSRMELPKLLLSDVEFLEKNIDTMDEILPPMKNFVLPGGNMGVSQAHVARCVCRRAERATIHLSHDFPIDPYIITYLNRLSDYLFVLSRHISYVTKAVEIPWKPRG